MKGRVTMEEKQDETKKKETQTECKMSKNLKLLANSSGEAAQVKKCTLHTTQQQSKGRPWPPVYLGINGQNSVFSGSDWSLFSHHWTLRSRSWSYFITSNETWKSRISKEKCSEDASACHMDSLATFDLVLPGLQHFLKRVQCFKKVLCA